MMKTSIVIPNWNGEHLIKKNFSSWVAMGVDEIIIVDDGSQDNSKLKVKNLRLKNKQSLALRAKNLKLIENKKNIGFAKSVNKGVAVASGDVVILLNTDVRPLSGFVDATIPHFKNKKVFGVSFSEAQWSWGRGKWVSGFVEHEPGKKTKKSHQTFWISGGSGAFRKSMWDKLGGFDPIYHPFYWEDIDLSYRAAKRGWKLIWEPKARVLHDHEGTISRYFKRDYINFVQERNQLLFIWKNITSSAMFEEHLWALIKRVVRFPGYLKVIMPAITKISSIIRSKETETREEKVSDEQVFGQFA